MLLKSHKGVYTFQVQHVKLPAVYILPSSASPIIMLAQPAVGYQKSRAVGWRAARAAAASSMASARPVDWSGPAQRLPRLRRGIVAGRVTAAGSDDDIIMLLSDFFYYYYSAACLCVILYTLLNCYIWT